MPQNGAYGRTTNVRFSGPGRKGFLTYLTYLIEVSITVTRSQGFSPYSVI